MLKSTLLAILLWPIGVWAQYSITESHLLNAPTPEVHASTLLEIPQNQLLAAWFGGEYESHEDVGIFLAQYDGKNWYPARKVASAELINGKKFPCWNPVLVRANANTIHLFYKVGPNPREWWGQMITSKNNGKTWSKPSKLPNGFLGPVRVKPFLLPNGKLLHPSSTETPDTDYWSMHFEISDKNGKNWKKISVDCDTFQVIQPTLILRPNNELMMMARSRHNKVIASTSKDWGKTWAPLRAINLPNPNSGIDAVNTPQGNYLMVYNPLTAGKEWWEGRSILVLGQSQNGEEWSEILRFENHDKGEFSYPAIIRTSDGKYHISYTYNRKQIKHVVVEMK